jgi:predicted ATP-dependent protease
MKLSVDQLARSITASHPALSPGYQTQLASQIPGQPRATKALEQGLQIQQAGYNLYLAGKSGTGRIRYVMQYLQPLVAQQQTPQDWLYVNNFDNPSEPRSIGMPPEQGNSLIKDINRLIEELLALFPTVFEHPSYLRQKTALQKRFDQTYNQAVDLVEREAGARQVAVFQEEGSITFTPMIDGQAVDEAMYAQMSDQQREHFRSNVEALEALLNDSLLEMPQWQRDLNEQLRDLRTTTIKQSLKPLFDQLQHHYQGNPGVLLYLAQINNHLPRVIEEQFIENPGGQDSSANKRTILEELYRPNLISSSSNVGAPIILETNPTYANLFGRINYNTEQGTVSSSYRQIIAGALHRANGGYLIMEIEKVLQDAATWEALKRSLRDGKIYMDPPASEMHLGLPQLLKPESIPLEIKVILLGPREIYYTLEQYDHDFDELFRVLVDFNNTIHCTDDNLFQFAEEIKHRAAELTLAELTPQAVARLAEYACRIAEHQHKLTACIDHIMEVLIEADHALALANDERLKACHIDQAIENRSQRNARLYEQVKEEILSGRTVISTEGKAIGQINGLSIIQVGESEFGCPIRITATIHPGNSGVVDIEREVELGQAVHSKGVLLLAGYLCGRFCKDFPLAISAHIAMEQSYGYVDGDSASLAELCALISTLINTPLRQDLAITGSVNQCGEVQAIGGVNEKIEGFFDICQARGLNGQQGVIIPASNAEQLMLNQQLSSAVSNGLFSIYTVSSVDETLALLTGLNIGTENDKGKFPAGSVNQQVVKRLKQFTKFLNQEKS